MQSSERRAESFRWPEWKQARDARVEKVESTWAVVSLHTLTECSGADAIGSRATVIRWWSWDWVAGDGAECSVWRLLFTAHCEHEWRKALTLLKLAKSVCACFNIRQYEFQRQLKFFFTKNTFFTLYQHCILLLKMSLANGLKSIYSSE